MAKRDFAGEWCDVVLSNIVEEVKALHELGVDISRFWAECIRLLGDGPWDLGKLAKMRVPSRIYNRLQEVLKECAGHVHWLQIAAEQAYRKDMAWGGSEGLKRVAGNKVLGRVTKVPVGMGLANDGTATYTANKRWQTLYADERRTVIRMVYIAGPNGEMRTAEEEPRSVLDRVGHVLRSIAIMWGHKRHAVRVLTCNIRPQTRLNQEAPGVKCSVEDDVFYIDDVRYGRIVYLEHSKLANGVCLGAEESRDAAFEGGVPAILMETDYKTRCTRTTGGYFPILEAGSVYRHEQPLEEAIFEIVHEPNENQGVVLNLVRIFFTWLMVGYPNLIRFMYKNRIRDEMAMKDAQRQREAAEAHARETEEELRMVLNAPNPGFLRSVRLAIKSPDHPGAFKRQKMPMAVMFVDLAGYTTWSEDLDADVTFEFAERLHGACQAICFRRGALIFKALGDGLMAVFPMGYEGDYRNVSLGDLVQLALDAAKEIMHDIRQTLVIPGTSTPPDLRIGINAGVGAIGVLARALDVITPVANFASRAEGACDPNEIVLTTDALFEMASQRERFDAETASPENGVTTATIRGALFILNGKRAVKKNQVETWALTDTQTERILRLLAERENRIDHVAPVTIAAPEQAGLEAISFEDLEFSPHGSRVMVRPSDAGTALRVDDAAANEQQHDTSPNHAGEDQATAAMLAVHADEDETPERPDRITDPGPPDFHVSDIREGKYDPDGRPTAPAERGKTKASPVRPGAARAAHIKAPTGTHGKP